VAGLNIAEVSAMDVSALCSWAESVEEHLSSRQKMIARDLMKEIRERLGFLKGVGRGVPRSEQNNKNP